MSSMEEELAWSAEPRRWGAGDLIALVVWTGAIAAFFWKAVSLQESLFYFDITEINYPYREFFASELRAGRFSRWLPGLYCGLPLYSESQAGYLHPFKYLLYPWMSTWAALNLDTVLSVWLTGVAAYGWLRRHVGPSGALTGAAIMGLSGYTWAHLIHSSMINALPSVPLAFWAIETTWAGGRLRGVALGALALACQVFAGHLQDTILTGMALGWYGLYRAAVESGTKRKAFAIGTSAGMVILAIALAAVQWIPSKELIDRSPRSAGLSWEDVNFGSWHPELLPTLLVREAYGTRAMDTDWMDGFYPYHEMNIYLGVIGLALAVLGAAAYRDRWVGFWVILAGIGGLFMLGRYTVLSDLLIHVPILNRGRIPVRYHLWVFLAVGALAAVGVDRLARPGPVRFRGAILTIAGLLLACVPVLVYVYTPVWTESARWDTAYHRARYGWLAQELSFAGGRAVALAILALFVGMRAARMHDPIRRRQMAALLPLLVIADLMLSHRWDSPTVPPAYWTVPPQSAEILKQDPSVIRVSGLGVLSAGEPGYATAAGRVNFFKARDTLAWSLPPVWGLSTSSGHTPIIPRRYKIYADNVEFEKGRFDVEGVSHLLSGESKRIRGWDAPQRAGSASINHNPGALPRARLLGRPVYAADEHEALKALKQLGREIRDRIIVEDPDRPLPEGAAVKGTASIVAELPERVDIAINAATDSYLFLADSYDPGWSVAVDGASAKIRPAQIAFRAVFVPKGRHHVVFQYRPAGFDLGLIVTTAAAVVGIVFLVWRPAFAPLGPEHAPLPWPRWWPWAVVALVVVIVAGSSVVWTKGQGLGVQERWDGSWHRFTWGAKIEAIKPPPAPES